MPEFKGLDQVDAMNEVVKTIVYVHQTLDEKKEELEDAIVDILDFYQDLTFVKQKVFDLDGKEIDMEVVKPLSRANQSGFDLAISIIEKQASAIFHASNHLKKELYQLGTNRINATIQNNPVEPKDQGIGEKIKNTIIPSQPKKEKEYTSLNELDDPFKISKNMIQEIENFGNLLDKFVELHTSYGIEVVEETNRAGQIGTLNLIVNFFKSRIKPRLQRIIDYADTVQREAERTEAGKALLQAKSEADRIRNSMMGGMMMPQPSN